MDEPISLASRLAFAVFALGVPAVAASAPAPALETPVAASSPVQAAPTPASPLSIPALTPVVLTIGKALSSKASKQGDIFPIRLAVPIVVDGHVLVQAGAEGVGEVIDAKHGGMSGSSGVLILVAHYLTVDGRQLRLRSMHIAQAGADNRTTAMVIGAMPFIGPLGLFITGGDTLVASGTMAQARTAENFTPDVSGTPVLPSSGNLPATFKQ